MVGIRIGIILNVPCIGTAKTNLRPREVIGTTIKTAKLKFGHNKKVKENRRRKKPSALFVCGDAPIYYIYGKGEGEKERAKEQTKTQTKTQTKARAKEWIKRRVKQKKCNAKAKKHKGFSLKIGKMKKFKKKLQKNKKSSKNACKTA